ncbi:TPA: DUF551 domain-containing protein [Escherichia coli]|nr:DUF551 domain-containing protein [Escherichia coli]
MSEINYQALREVAERAIPAMERLLMLPADDDLLSEQELKDYGVDIDALNAFKFLAGPETVLALLDERERNQQYIKRRDQENEDIALTVGKLRVELEAAKKRIAELEAEPVIQTYKLTFEQWLEQQHDKIDVDCGCVSTEMLMHWIRVAYEAGNYPVTPDGWISCSERMPEKGQNVLISVNFDSSLVEPLICSARYTGSTFRSGDVTVKPGNGIEQATHWMPLPEPPQESKSE